MKNYQSGCLICGEALVYTSENRPLTCSVCQGIFESNAACESGHYVCDGCHAKAGHLFITEYAKKTASHSPIEIAQEMMAHPLVHMHGPEHHFLVVAALLAAYQNAGGTINLDSALEVAYQRAKGVPGGICGLWGSCGAAIGTGIFISILGGATPLSQQEWSLANLMTSESLYKISQNGGPRCCKRDSFLSIAQAVTFAKTHFGVEMDSPVTIRCTFHPLNPTCKGENCLYYPS